MMKFSLLLLIDCPSTGYGLRAGESFGEQLGRRLWQSGYDLTLVQYRVPPVGAFTDWLPPLPLSDHDLIVIQPRITDLVNPQPRWQRIYGKLLENKKLTVRRLLDLSMLASLRAHRHRTLLLTPFPTPDRSQNRLLRRATRRLADLGEQANLAVFDAGQVVGSDAVYFADNEQLNAVSHELIGRWLFDFYQYQPVVTPIKRGR